ncbi:hypothetical protein Agabi119p4_2670 [Agaricus bisporus var. burnettii]|uniref:CFEM domain-containing protein n=1 Tax=Agaricus bisporus var. burnettii TaxID=192524 RepID=A0A8H7F9Y6_AGABI|nr:hypothetical protein Agabi119p4_2670 [Agaricus bisporus var. burnettii]
MRLSSSHILFLTLVYYLSLTWAQTLIPPSSLPDVSTSGSMTSGSSPAGGSATLTSSSSISSASSGSGSGSVSATRTSSAQFPSLSGISACVNTCLATSVADVNCDDLVGVDCWCPNARFPLTYFNCVANGCTSELSTAENLVQQFCRQSNATLSATSVSFPSFPMSSSQSVSATMTTQSSGTSSGASSDNDSPPAATSSSAASSIGLNTDAYTTMGSFFVLMMTAVACGFLNGVEL